MSLKDAVVCSTVMNKAGSKSSVVGTTDRLHVEARKSVEPLSV